MCNAHSHTHTHRHRHTGTDTHTDTHTHRHTDTHTSLSLSGGNATARFCEIATVPFRGAPCSDAAGRERSYGDLWQLMHNSTQPTTPVRLDQLLVSKFFNYRAADGSLHQVWLDDPDTLRPKFALAKSLGLRGVGVWNFDLLDYTSTDTRVRAAMDAMWEAFNAFLD